MLFHAHSYQSFFDKRYKVENATISLRLTNTFKRREIVGLSLFPLFLHNYSQSRIITFDTIVTLLRRNALEQHRRNHMNPEQAKVKLLSFVPISGEIDYDDMYSAVIASPDRDAIRLFHKMRRSGELAVRLELDAQGKVHQYVSRVTGQG